MKKAIPIAAVVAVVAVGLVIWRAASSSHPVRESVGAASDSSAVRARISAAATATVGCGFPGGAGASDADGACDGDVPKGAEEDRVDAEEAAVDAFDALTDKWMDPAVNGVSMADVERFVAQLAKVPVSHREECLQRALNLVPDENAMLLAGVLMDKSQPKEFLELVFNDILNRDDAVKAPVLAEIHRDRSHPCWEDADWILETDDGDRGP